MSRFYDRFRTPAVLLLLVAGMECGIRAERTLHIGSFYHELSVEQREMNPVERALASVLLAAGEKLKKHKRQTHVSLPSAFSALTADSYLARKDHSVAVSSL